MLLSPFHTSTEIYSHSGMFVSSDLPPLNLTGVGDLSVGICFFTASKGLN